MLFYKESFYPFPLSVNSGVCKSDWPMATSSNSAYQNLSYFILLYSNFKLTMPGSNDFDDFCGHVWHYTKKKVIFSLPLHLYEQKLLRSCPLHYSSCLWGQEGFSAMTPIELFLRINYYSFPSKHFLSVVDIYIVN